MPDFFPAPQLPTGMAENLIQMAAHRNDPWAQLAKSLGGDVGNMIAAHAAKKAATMTPEDYAAMARIVNGPAPSGPPLPGTNGPLAIGRDVTQPLPSVRPEMLPILQGMMQMKKQEDISRETTSRVLGAAGIRAGAEEEKLNLPVSDSTRELFNKAGLTLDPSATTVRKEDYESALKMALSKIPKPKATQKESDLTEEEQQALTMATLRKKNPLPPSIITFRGPRAKTIAQALIKDPTYNPNIGEAGLAGARAGASFEASGMPQKLARAAQSAGNSLDVLLDASKAIPRTDVQLLNKPLIHFKSQYAPEGQNWLALVTGARLELARAYAGGNDPGEQQMAEAYKAIPDSITETQLESLVPALRKQLQGVVKGAMTVPGTEEKPKGNATQVPEIGTIKKGYKFIGGNPSDPNSWERQ